MAYTTLDAGRLDKRVSIQRATEATGSGGTLSITWADSARVWAEVAPGSGREFFAAQQLMPELSHVITIRHTTGVTPKHRVVYVSNGTTRTFAIHAVNDPMERHEQLVLFCSEIAQS